MVLRDAAIDVTPIRIAALFLVLCSGVGMACLAHQIRSSATDGAACLLLALPISMTWLMSLAFAMDRVWPVMAILETLEGSPVVVTAVGACSATLVIGYRSWKIASRKPARLSGAVLAPTPLLLVPVAFGAVFGFPVGG